MKEIFKKIVPTFCQDIIASIISSNIDKKYDEISELITKIYRESRYNNFYSFFENIKSMRNIIYTFSKITEIIFNEEIQVKNMVYLLNKIFQLKI